MPNDARLWMGDQRTALGQANLPAQVRRILADTCGLIKPGLLTAMRRGIVDTLHRELNQLVARSAAQ